MNREWHGLTSRKKGIHPLFHVWWQMVQRCHFPKHEKYHFYGARGISVCEKWRHSFSTFLADMGERPPGMTLERIDNNANYEPGNVKWATRQEQSRNRRSSIFLEYNGQRLCVEEWARQLGCPGWTLNRWIFKYGFTLDQLFILKAQCVFPGNLRRARQILIAA